MITCSKCREEKPESQFYTRSDRLNKHQPYCKACHSSYCMERWIKQKEKAIVFKGGCCNDCKQQFPRELYDFHHLDPLEKEFNWVKLRLKSWDKITKELEKTVLLCANCHRLRHIQVS